MSARPDLSLFDNSWYSPGRPLWICVAWFLVGLPLLRCNLLPFSGFRCWLLRLFGARIGNGVVIKPGVRVKYPWLLSVGQFSWLGEDVWIDNLSSVTIDEHACISQGAYLCTGNHDWADPAFGLVAKPIVIEQGAWVGAHAVVCPGVMLGHCAIALAGAIVSQSIPAFEIHAGNPARLIRRRTIRDL